MEYIPDCVRTVVQVKRYLRDWKISVLISSVMMYGGAVLMYGGAVLMPGGAVLMYGGAVLMPGGAVLMHGGGVLMFRRNCIAVLDGREISDWSFLR